MKKDWKNNSSVYLSKTSKAYYLVLYPILFLLAIGCLFLFLGKIEVVIRGNARIVGKELYIQGTSDEVILENHLVENKEVKKGDILIKYETKNFQTEIEKFDKQLKEILEEEKSLLLLKKSLEEGKNFFVRADSYGYYNKFKEYQADIKNYDTQINLLKSNESTQNANKMAVVEETNQLINEKQNYLNELKNLRQVISDDSTYFETGYSKLASKFNLMKEVISKGTEEERNIQKKSNIVDIDTEITQVQSEVDNLKLTNVQNSISESKQDDPNRLNEEKEKLKEINITQVKANLNELNKQKIQVKEDRKSILNMASTFEIKAPQAGIIHLNSEIDTSSTQVPRGTKLASLFISEGDTIKFETIIPANEINKVKTGEVVKLELDQKGVSREIYKGKITEISQTSTVTEQGTFYTVKGELDKNIKRIRYGETGRLSIIVGKKSYFNYFKDILFNK